MEFVTWYVLGAVLLILGAVAYVVVHAARSFVAGVRAEAGTRVERVTAQPAATNDANLNNRRARLWVTIGLAVTIASFVIVICSVVFWTPSVATNDPIPDMNRSSIRTGYLPNGSAFYGFDTATSSSTVASRPATAWGWLIFWLIWWFVVLPSMWFGILVYAFFSMREEIWETMQDWYASAREGIANMRERGEREGDASAVPAGTIVRWPEAPVLATAGAATAAAAGQGESTWSKIMKFVKGHSGELVGLMFLADEWLEKRNRNK